MMIQVLSLENVDFQHCFLESIISKGMHRRLARNGWRLSPYGRAGDEEEDSHNKKEALFSHSSQDRIFLACLVGIMMVAFYIWERPT
jgi:hypothetical protein